MAELSALADSIEATFGLTLVIVSGGNSANLQWALSDSDIGRINELRLGEAILLGREPLYRQPINGLFTDTFTHGYSQFYVVLRAKPHFHFCRCKTHFLDLQRFLFKTHDCEFCGGYKRSSP